MDTQPETPTLPSAQVIGNAFVEQYYHILHHSPELVHRFYQESSVLSRPEHNGVMTSVTTTEGINDKICSFDYKSYKAEIKTADAQESYKDGVIVLVTGCLTGSDNIRRKFTQTFFLAPQDKGYFVLNDVFRYVEDSESLESSKDIVNGVHDTPLASPTSDPEPVHVYDSPEVDSTTLIEEVRRNVEEKPHTPVDNDRKLFNEEEVIMDHEPHSNDNHVLAVPESASYTTEEDAPKKSYASILSSQTKKAGSGPTKVYVQANTSRVGATKTENRTLVPVPHDPVTEESAPSASGSVNTPESGNAQEEVEGHSVYVRNLPLNFTAAQLQEEFTKFGPIKQGGVQIRSNKDICFGFVEFQSFSSMNNAIQASPVTIGSKQAVVEIKRTTMRVGGGRERFPSGRGGGFRSDSFRGHRNFVSGRGYGRNEVGNRGDFSGRGRGPSGRSGEGNQQGRERGGRRGGSSWNPVSA